MSSRLGPPFVDNFCHLTVSCPQDPTPYQSGVGSLYPFCPIVCTATPYEEREPNYDGYRGLRFLY